MSAKPRVLYTTIVEALGYLLVYVRTFDRLKTTDTVRCFWSSSPRWSRVSLGQSVHRCLLNDPHRSSTSVTTESSFDWTVLRNLFGKRRDPDKEVDVFVPRLPNLV